MATAGGSGECGPAGNGRHQLRRACGNPVEGDRVVSGEVCKCCGQTLPPKFMEAGKLTPAKQKLCDIVFKAGPHGIRTDRVFALLYENHPDGGPETGYRALYARISQVNKYILKPHGWQIKCDHADRSMGEFGFYRMVKL